MTRNDRVRIIRSKIAAGTWQPARDIMALADEWELDEEVVFGIAGDAVRLTAATRMTLDEEVTGSLARLQAARSTALDAKKPITCCGVIEMIPQPDVKGMLAAERLYLEVIGALTAKKADASAGGDAKALLLSEVASNPLFARQLVGCLTREELLDCVAAAGRALP